ncbi:MAG TPA: TerB N-terminal domain-containing protein, partial [Thermomicrobiales bacterium]|nr:TerB N-terminal domain-containing protein [Thermomicrobiales bacterium]
MGIFDWWKKRRQEVEDVRRLVETVAAGSGKTAPATRPPAAPARRPSTAPMPRTVATGRANGRWLAQGESIEIQGYRVSGGMIYVGKSLPTQQGGPEPALIDPDLRVDQHQEDTLGRGLDYWPSYAGISPKERAGYLNWLATGRRNPVVSIGFVFLYFYGLERRFLLDV